ncbi:hypothetical protein TNCV_4972481 [Trichonephila clavipes]|nr:hypothetical protein TNCV_4972481 [Trichonephila clavipes]
MSVKIGQLNRALVFRDFPPCDTRKTIGERKKALFEMFQLLTVSCNGSSFACHVAHVGKNTKTIPTTTCGIDKIAFCRGLLATDVHLPIYKLMVAHHARPGGIQIAVTFVLPITQYDGLPENPEHTGIEKLN